MNVPQHDAKERGGAKITAQFLWSFTALLVLAAFIWIASHVSKARTLAWDVPVLRWIHAHASPARDTAMVFITLCGSGRSLTPVMIPVVLLLLARCKFERAIAFAFSFGGTALLNYLLKRGFQRVRPHLWDSPAPEFDYGFPSGHSVISCAFFLALVIGTWNTRWRGAVVTLGGAFVVLVGFSRVYLGMHYPSDVLAGWALAISFVAAVELALPALKQTDAAGSSHVK